MNNIPFSSEQELLEKLIALRHAVLHEGKMSAQSWLPDGCSRDLWLSAVNLAAYMALTSSAVLPDMAKSLRLLGLAIPGTHKTAVIAEMDGIIASLAAICRQPLKPIHRKGERSYYCGDRLLRRNSHRIFGVPPAGRNSHIMVTLPPTAASDYMYVKQLLQNGMTIARINCAYDAPAQWEAMIANIRRAERASNCVCKILMDLCGPKARLTSILLTDSDGRLYAGDSVLLTRQITGNMRWPLTITCSLPQVIDSLRIGDQVMIDDGKIEAEVEQLLPEGAVLKVRKSGPRGSRLKLHKGLNFPRTPLCLSPLTAKDLSDLDFVLAHADIIGSSFIRSAADIELLQQQLELCVGCSRAGAMPLVAKIETAEAVEALPSIIFRAAAYQPLALMIARGDLAVEVGYDKLADLQTKISCLAKAAHVPVIWASQVLDNLVKNGRPSRAEMSDVSMAAQAECIMLNKGAFLPEAVGFLASILPKSF